MTVASFFMLHVATALLPPHDEIDYEYYAILNLPKKPSVTVQQIRKAYKLLSLQLHPDKIAQKQGTNNNNGDTMSLEEATKLYAKVQEAVNVLSDDSKRQVYINYNYSVARYKFVMNEESKLVVKNMQMSSFYNRTKLWLFIVLFISLLLLLQPILIAMKVNSITGTTIVNNNLLHTSWFYILLPFWICYVGCTLLYIWVVFIKSLREWIRYGPPQTNLPKITYLTILGTRGTAFLNEEEEEDEDNDEERNQDTENNSHHRDATGTRRTDTNYSDRTFKNGSMILNSELIIDFLNSVAIPITIFMGIVLFVQQWDKNSRRKYNDEISDGSETNWMYPVIPFYVTMLCIIVRKIISLQQIHYVQSCIISNSNPILVNMTTNDDEFRNVNSEDTNQGTPSSKMKMIKQKYMIVQPDPEKLQITLAVVRQMKVLHHQQQQQRDSAAPAPVAAEHDDDDAIMDEEMEYIRIQCSDEYTILERMKKEYYTNITTIVLIHVTQLTVILCQIQGTISAPSWYIVFLPLLIYYGVAVLISICKSLDADINPERKPLSSNDCASCSILVVLCLIIAKLEQSYSTDATKNSGIDDDGTFNTMWILVPLFLLSGCIIQLFICCICLPDPPMDVDSSGMSVDTNVNDATQRLQQRRLVLYHQQHRTTIRIAARIYKRLLFFQHQQRQLSLNQCMIPKLQSDQLDTSTTTTGNEEALNDVEIGGTTGSDHMYDLD